MSSNPRSPSGDDVDSLLAEIDSAMGAPRVPVAPTSRSGAPVRGPGSVILEAPRREPAPAASAPLASAASIRSTVSAPGPLQHAGGHAAPVAKPSQPQRSYPDGGSAPMLAEDDDVDSLLRECGDTLGHSVSQPTFRPALESPTPVPSIPRIASGGSGPGATKCTVLWLGGTAVPRGQSASLADIRACDRLRCTSCDFRVLTFPDTTWAADVDYLFFRNNYPDQARLHAMMRKGAGHCAYCCQCTWRAVREPEQAVFARQRWVCGGHQ